MVGKVVVVGGINLDLVIGAPRLPARGETIVGDDLRRFGGGKGANQAVAAARMGAQVAVVGRVGADEFGDALLDDLRREGVDVSAVARDDGPTGVALITVASDGSNTIVVSPGANGRVGPGDVERAREVVAGADSLLLQLEVPLDATTRAAEIARAAGRTVFLNPSPARPLPDGLLGNVNLLVLNETELDVLGGADGDASPLLHRGVGAVVLTLGERGARLVDANGTREIPAYPVRSVDSTAAGDAFLGALAALMPELGVERALDAAAASGALATTKWGAQPSLPTRDEVEALVRTARGADRAGDGH